LAVFKEAEANNLDVKVQMAKRDMIHRENLWRRGGLQPKVLYSVARVRMGLVRGDVLLLIGRRPARLGSRCQRR